MLCKDIVLFHSLELFFIWLENLPLPAVSEKSFMWWILLSRVISCTPFEFIKYIIFLVFYFVYKLKALFIPVLRPTNKNSTKSSPCIKTWLSFEGNLKFWSEFSLVAMFVIQISTPATYVSPWLFNINSTWNAKRCKQDCAFTIVYSSGKIGEGCILVRDCCK